MSVERPGGDAAITLREVAAAHAAGRKAEARALCDRVLAAAPSDGDTLMWSGLIAMTELCWAEAAQAFQQALAARLEPWSLANLGACYLKLGRLEEAEACLRQATALEPGLFGAYISLAAVLHGLRRFEDALAELACAARIAPDDHQVDQRRGCTLAALGRYDEAQQAFERSVALAPDFVYSRLAKFDRATFESIATPPAFPPPVVVLAAEAPDGGGVILVSCNPEYARKYGFAFMRSYAQHARTVDLLHIHVVDPDANIVEEIRAAAAGAGLGTLCVTTEQSPFPASAFRQRRTYYACARMVHFAHWLERYQRPILVLDTDVIVERPVYPLFDSLKGNDLCLNAREPIDSPWLDVIANVIVASPTARAKRYFERVASYAVALLHSEPQAWMTDQAALYCVLKMLERYDAPPAVSWLRQAHESGLFHLGYAYDHAMADPRFTKYSMPHTHRKGG